MIVPSPASPVPAAPIPLDLAQDSRSGFFRRVGTFVFGCAIILQSISCSPANEPEAGLTSSDASQRGLVIVPIDAPEAQVKGAPERSNFYSFGEVQDGAVARHTFRLKNVEEKPIAITGIHPGCGCTAADVTVITADGEHIDGAKPKDPHDPWVIVPTDAAVDLTLRIDTRDIPSKNKDRTLTTRLVTDSDVGRYRSFELHLFVAQDLQINPKRLDLGQVAVGVGASGTVDIVPIAGRETEVVGVRSGPAGVRVEVSPADILGRSTWQVQASLDPPLELGPIVGKIVIETRRASGSESFDLTLPFSAQVVPDLHVDPQRLVLLQRSGDAIAPAICTLSSLRPGERLKVLSSELQGAGASHFSLQVAPEEPDARGRSHRWTVTLQPKAAWPTELLRGEVLVELERSQESELSIPWVYHPN